jgi:PBP1b-binding outer membrane lipoprotein LpoB
MKMSKIYILLFAFIIVGCAKTQEDRPPYVKSQGDYSSIAPVQHTLIDSLLIVIHQKSLDKKDAELQYDSLFSKLKQQRILIRATAEKCHKYAAIVKKNPSRSIFIVNWIDRAFLWVNEK